MNNYKFRHVIISFYRFVEISEKKEKKKILDEALFKKEIKGTILLSDEGINGSLAGKENELIEIIKFLKKLIKVRNMELKVNDINSIPFNKLKVRLKKEEIYCKILLSLSKLRLAQICLRSSLMLTVSSKRKLLM